MLWRYNLHYQDGLLNADTPAELKFRHVEQWINENPVGRGVGWAPYPISIRIVNWVKWALSGGETSARMRQSLADQVRFLVPRVEYHLLGNHLFANAKALVFAGLFFQGPEADSWLALGLKILNRQIPEQFLADGGHFERSPTYHALLTEDLLDLLQVFRLYDRHYPATWDAVAARTVKWMIFMTRPDGRPPLFNDAAYGVASSLPQICGYAASLQLPSPECIPEDLTILSASGYFLFQNDVYSLFGDVGPIGPDYIPGHAHCDMLSFELYAHGAPIIVDTGVSTYQAGQRRDIERGTAAHNTTQVGDLEQSEMWGAFRVGRRARILKVNNGINWIEASHDGFRGAGCTHTRRFTLESRTVCLHDSITSGRRSTPPAFARLHFAPDTRIEKRQETVTANSVHFDFVGAKKLLLDDYLYAPQFNTLVPAKVLTIEFGHSLETRIAL